MPIVKETKEEAAEGESELEPRLATEFRGLAARANYLSLDRPDIQFATKGICREMAKPTERHAEDEEVGQVFVASPSLYFGI